MSCRTTHHRHVGMSGQSREVTLACGLLMCLAVCPRAAGSNELNLPDSGSENACPSQWSKAPTLTTVECLSAPLSPRGYIQARATCLNYGFELSTPRQLRDNQYFQANMETHNLSQMWLGVTHHLRSNQWLDTQGRPVIYAEWDLENPEFDTKGDLCAVMNFDGKWALEPCVDPVPYFCSIYRKCPQGHWGPLCRLRCAANCFHDQCHVATGQCTDCKPGYAMTNNSTCETGDTGQGRRKDPPQAAVKMTSSGSDTSLLMTLVMPGALLCVVLVNIIGLYAFMRKRNKRMGVVEGPDASELGAERRSSSQSYKIDDTCYTGYLSTAGLTDIWAQRRQRTQDEDKTSDISMRVETGVSEAEDFSLSGAKG